MTKTQKILKWAEINKMRNMSKMRKDLNATTENQVRRLLGNLKSKGLINYEFIGRTCFLSATN